MNLDFKKFGMRGYSYGVVALRLFTLSLILSVIGTVFLSVIIGISAFVIAIKAYRNSKEEMEAEIENIKAHYGRRMGLVVILMQVIYLVLSIIIGIFSLMLY